MPRYNLQPIQSTIFGLLWKHGTSCIGCSAVTSGVLASPHTPTNDKRDSITSFVLLLEQVLEHTSNVYGISNI